MNNHFDIYLKDSSCLKIIESIKLHDTIIKCISSEKKKHFFLIIDKYKEEGIKIHIFKKQIKNNNIILNKVIYLTSIFLDKYIPLNNIYNWQIIDEENKNIKIPENIFNIGFKTYIPLSPINTRHIYDINNIYFQANLDFIKTGYYYNFNNITWQLLFLNLSGYYNNININEVNTSYFKLDNIDNNYYFGYNYNNIYHKFMINTLFIFCDICNKQITHLDNTNIKFWHSEFAGDICNKCYSNKKNRELFVKKYVKSQLLLEGKKVLFKKELLKYKDINYENIKIKLDHSKLEKVNKILLNEIFNNKLNNNCSICFDLYQNKSLFTGICGHVFHESCCKNLKSCPICRKKTNFFKLYL